MPSAVRNTVDRLDRPSAYGAKSFNKKRRYNNREDDQKMEVDEEQPQTLEEKLQNATTLYVGNL